MADGIDEVDLALLDGVHVNPRVKFDELAEVLGLSGATVARRWHRLEIAGRAWVSSALGPALPLVGALLEAECEPGAAQRVADRWAALPQVFSVHLTTGRYNVYGLVAAADEHMLTRLIVDVLPRIPGVRAVRSSSVYQLFSGTYWRLGAISADQAREVAAAPARPARRVFDELDRRLYLALQVDGRLTYRQLADELACSEVMARRRLQALTRAGLVTFRADFARAEAGWPANVVLLLQLRPADSVEVVGRDLARWPETRVCAAIVGGAAQLFVTVQVHELAALAEVTARLDRAYPGLAVLSRRVTLRAVKSFGRLLDRHGRACGMVPVDPWSTDQMAIKLTQ